MGRRDTPLSPLSPLPLDPEVVGLAAKVLVIGFTAGAALLTWSCLALSARWSDLEERMGAPATPAARPELGR